MAAPRAVAAALTAMVGLVAASPAVASPPDGSTAKRAPLEYRLEEVAFVMDRGACRSGCPTYSVALNGSGLVLYYGQEGVEERGRRVAMVSREDIFSLLQAFYDARFFDLDDRYLSGYSPKLIEGGRVIARYKGNTGSPRTALTLRIRDVEKRVVFQPEYAPSELLELAGLFERIAGVRRWTGTTRAGDR